MARHRGALVSPTLVLPPTCDHERPRQGKVPVTPGPQISLRPQATDIPQRLDVIRGVAVRNIEPGLPAIRGVALRPIEPGPPVIRGVSVRPPVILVLHHHSRTPAPGSIFPSRTSGRPSNEASKKKNVGRGGATCEVTGRGW